MKNLHWVAVAGMGFGLSLWMTACGGGSTTTPPPTTYALTVNSTAPASGVAITVSPADNNGAANGTTSFSRTYNAGASVTLTAPATASGNTFTSWTGCTSANAATCTVTLNSSAAVTANYATPVKITPTVTVTPGSSSITTLLPLTVTVAVSVPSGDATPTGSVTLTSGSYTSAATTLSSGDATIAVPAGSLAAGSDTLMVSYTPDAGSAAAYTSASGTSSEMVTAPVKITPTVTVTPSQSSITTVQALTVAVAVSGSPAPTGSVTLTNGSYKSAAATLSGGSGTINVPAGSLAAGTDTLTVSYTPDAGSASAYTSASGTGSETVTKATPTVTVTPSASIITAAQGLTVTVAVSDGSGNPTPTGAVTLTSGSYTSAAATLSGGSGTINVPAGSLAAGTDTLTVSYTPDTAGAATYNSASGTGGVTVTGVATLTVESAAPSSGVSIQATPADNNSKNSGTTPMTLTYNAGSQVTLTAPATSGSYAFVSWTGCATASGETCTVTMSANTTVTANYNEPGVTSITVTPTSAIIGSQVTFKATVVGTGNFSNGVTWSLTCPSCGSLSAGTLSSTGVYTTPYPAPASVTVTATSTMTGFTTVSGSATVTLSEPATVAGPALSVNVSMPGNAISPDIYGMDAYLLHASAADTAAAAKANIPVDRWGGDSTERYNYQLDVTNSIDDWFFENGAGTGGDGWAAVIGSSAFDALVESNGTKGIKTLGTVPVLGWVSKDSTSCSFPKTTYPNQLAVNGKPAFSTDGRNCGSGVYPEGASGCTSSSGCNVTADGTAVTTTSIAAPPPAPPAASAVNAAWAEGSWTGGWVNYLVNKFGPGSSNNGIGGVAIYDLDNEPSWWSSESFDVHPNHFTYDEVTKGGIGTALAIKTVDPTALVSGPVMDFWWAYFYSMEDIRNGWSSGAPCYRPWSSPGDRTAHGGVPFIEYYLRQMAAAETTYGVRLLDYVDLHTYFAAQYPANSGNGVGLTTAGDTGAQQVRLNSTRALWDPTYTDSSTLNGGGYPQPNYITDSNYTANCNPPQQAPQLIRMMKTWVANDYPGTKLAIDEYNWGGLESINGAVAQADILGIFGREGLDLGAFWPTQNPSTQIPGMMAFAIYRNYDGNKSMFGNTVLPSTSTNAGADGEGQLAVYGALRSSDNAVTVVVINKTYGPLTSTVSLIGLSSNPSTAQAYLYSNANLNAIVAQPAVTVTPPPIGTSVSTIANYSFPAQSITLFVVPQ